MAKQFFRMWNPTPISIMQVELVNHVINQYMEQGYTLTLRQLYYQLVAKHGLTNSEKSYKNLGKTVTRGREAGMIDWNGIEDRNRSSLRYPIREDDEDLIWRLQHQVSMDHWTNQPTYCEVWVEKEALGNVIAKACDPFKVTYMSCKGYLSASEAYRAGRRFRYQQLEGKRCVMIHLGDHDPSGIDMTRDNSERIDLFSQSNGVEVRRIALNMDQIELYEPPPNPAKVTDSRSSGYIKKFGRSSWELDALEPSVLVDLISREIDSLIEDREEWDLSVEEEAYMVDKMINLHKNWDEIKEKL